VFRQSNVSWSLRQSEADAKRDHFGTRRLSRAAELRLLASHSALLPISDHERVERVLCDLKPKILLVPRLNESVVDLFECRIL
jgi:hypothetical protein